jgi:hypothetical protein
MTPASPTANHVKLTRAHDKSRPDR